jgi:hypothetical protein
MASQVWTLVEDLVVFRETDLGQSQTKRSSVQSLLILTILETSVECVHPVVCLIAAFAA